MSRARTELLSRQDPIYHEGRLGLLCNQTAYDFESGRYSYEIFRERGSLRRLFFPEHGLFGELQDQIGLDEAGYFKDEKVELISLYGSNESSLQVTVEKLGDLDLLIVDLHDIGCRYYTFSTTLYYIFQTLAQARLKLKIVVVDYPNPCGRQVEGTLLSEKYGSFVGMPGLPHRYGLTIGELCGYLNEATGAHTELEIIKYKDETEESSLMPISPSPNMVSVTTARIYSGQCLLEGTNLSEGRGTTRPFEIFGAPYLKTLGRKYLFRVQPEVELRPLRFIPTFHKYAGEICEGWQLHLKGNNYHSLLQTLDLIRYLKNEYPDAFRFREGIYEFLTELSAIEILVGDLELLNYIEGKLNFTQLRALLSENEEAWIERISPYLIYPEPLFRYDLFQIKE